MRTLSLAVLIAAAIFGASPLLAQTQAPFANILGPVQDYFKWQKEIAGEVRVFEIQKEMLREVPANNIPPALDKRPLSSVPDSGPVNGWETGGSSL